MRSYIGTEVVSNPTLTEDITSSSTISSPPTTTLSSVSEPQTLDATDHDVPQPSKAPSLVQMDVGTIYSKAESPADFSTVMHSLTVAEKYELLTNHGLQ